jgi:hypothetical protein
LWDYPEDSEREQVTMSLGAKRKSGGLRFATALLFTGLFLVPSVGAQVTTVETIPSAVDAEGKTANDRVNEIVLTLRLIAGGVAMGAVGFWWHTRPTQRWQAAVDRGEVDGTVSAPKQKKPLLRESNTEPRPRSEAKSSRELLSNSMSREVPGNDADEGATNHV